MGFFDKLFGKKEEQQDLKSSSDKSQPIIGDMQFDIEVYETMSRFCSIPNLPLDAETVPIHLSTVFTQQYDSWKSIKSLPDRRRVIYSVLDSIMGDMLQLWQVMECFIQTRQAEQALKIAKLEQTSSDLENPNYWASLSRTNFVLTNYSEAESNALKGLEIDSTNKRLKIILADIYHFTNKQIEAHRIYDEILEESISKERTEDLHMYELWGFEGNILNSPIYASSWLKADKNATEENWNWAGDEFYYSPHFRSQHAYYFIANKDYVKALVKLLTITKEMPWYREAVFNANNLIEQLSQVEALNFGEVFKDDKIRLTEMIRSNGWTMDNMHTYTL